MNYEYVKGKGWIPGPGVPYHIMTMACGTVVRMEAREPKPGEYFNGALPGSRMFWNPDGSPVWEAWVEHHQNKRYERMPFCHGPQSLYHADLHVTLVPVIGAL